MFAQMKVSEVATARSVVAKAMRRPRGGRGFKCFLDAFAGSARSARLLDVLAQWLTTAWAVMHAGPMGTRKRPGRRSEPTRDLLRQGNQLLAEAEGLRSAGKIREAKAREVHAAEIARRVVALEPRVQAVPRSST